jgi:hypothetical protein
MKNWILIAVIAVLCGCTKENPLLGTEWISVESNISGSSFSVDAYTLQFKTETTGDMIYANFRNDIQIMSFTYTYIKPNVILTYKGNSIKGVLDGDIITFDGMGKKGSAMVFNKKQ